MILYFDSSFFDIFTCLLNCVCQLFDKFPLQPANTIKLVKSELSEVSRNFYYLSLDFVIAVFFI